MGLIGWGWASAKKRVDREILAHHLDTRQRMTPFGGCCEVAEG